MKRIPIVALLGVLALGLGLGLYQLVDKPEQHIDVSRRVAIAICQDAVAEPGDRLLPGWTARSTGGELWVVEGNSVHNHGSCDIVRETGHLVSAFWGTR